MRSEEHSQMFMLETILATVRRMYQSWARLIIRLSGADGSLHCGSNSENEEQSCADLRTPTLALVSDF